LRFDYERDLIGDKSPNASVVATTQPGSNKMSGFSQTQSRSWTQSNSQTPTVSSSTRVAYALSVSTPPM
jgi:hypothetical protein